MTDPLTPDLLDQIAQLGPDQGTPILRDIEAALTTDTETKET